KRHRRARMGRTCGLLAHGAELGALSGTDARPPLKKVMVGAAPVTARHLPAVHRSRAKWPSARHDFATASFCNRAPRPPGLSPDALSLGRGHVCARAPSKEHHPMMRVEMRPAMPSALPRAAVSQARPERLVRGSALSVAGRTATLAAVAAAVMLGIT